MKKPQLEKEYFFEQYYELVQEKGAKKIFRVKKDFGQGNFVVWTICPGFFLTYTDYEMPYIENEQNFSFSETLSLLHHTLRGGGDILLKDGLSGVFSEGETMVYTGRGDFVRSTIQAGGIECISFQIYYDVFKKEAQKYFLLKEENLQSLTDMTAHRNKMVAAVTSFHIAQKLERLKAYIQAEKEMEIRLQALDILIQDGEMYHTYRLANRKLYKAQYIDKIKQMAAFMQAQYGEEMSIYSLSKRFHISQTYIKEIFPRLYGMPPMTYLREIRLKKAKEILVEQSLSIIDLANEVGYMNPSKFSKAFKKKYGVLPSNIK